MAQQQPQKDATNPQPKDQNQKAATPSQNQSANKGTSAQNPRASERDMDEEEGTANNQPTEQPGQTNRH